MPCAQPGLVPPLRTLHRGVKHAASTSNSSIPLADSILFGQPFLSALFAAFLANTPDPTYRDSALISQATLTLPGQAYVLFLAFLVRPGGPACLCYAPQARGAAAGGRAPGQRPGPPPRPAPRAPRARAGSLSTSWRVGPQRPWSHPRSSRRR